MRQDVGESAYPILQTRQEIDHRLGAAGATLSGLVVGGVEAFEEWLDLEGAV